MQRTHTHIYPFHPSTFIVQILYGLGSSDLTDFHFILLLADASCILSVATYLRIIIVPRLRPT